MSVEQNTNDEVLSFEQFISQGTGHYKDLIKELEKNGANSDKLMSTWVQRICDMKNQMPAAQYYAVMFQAMNDIYHAFLMKKDQFPDQWERCQRLMKLMWTLSDKLREDCGEVLLLEDDLDTEEHNRRRAVYTHAVSYFKQAMTESWISIRKIADRNLTIQWGGLIYYSIYMFEQIAIANKTFRPNGFEIFAQKLVKGSEPGEQ